MSITFIDFIQSPLLCVWFSTIGVVTIFRSVTQNKFHNTVVNNQKNHQSIETLFFETMGISFGTSGLWQNTNQRQVLILFLSIFGMIAGILCTGILFEQFSMERSRFTINNIEDIGKNKSLIVCVPWEFRNDGFKMNKM